MDDLDAMGAGNSRRNEEREEETRQDTERDTGAEASVSPEEIAAEEEATTAGHVIYQLLMGNQGSSLRHMYFLNNEEEEEEEEEEDDDDDEEEEEETASHLMILRLIARLSGGRDHLRRRRNLPQGTHCSAQPAPPLETTPMDPSCDLYKELSGVDTAPTISCRRRSQNIIHKIDNMRYKTDTLSGTERANTALHYLPRCCCLADVFDARAFCGTYSHDGSVFICASQDNNIYLYNTEGYQFTKFKTIPARDVGWSVLDVAFSPDQHWFVYSTWSPCVHVCNVYGDEERHYSLDLRPQQEYHFCAFSATFSADGNEILVSASDGDIYVYDQEKQDRTLIINAHQDDVSSVKFADESGNVIFSGGDDGVVKVWDRRSLRETDPQPVGIFAGHKDGITFIDSKGDGRYLITNSKDQTIKLWDVRKFSSQGAVRSTIDRVAHQLWDYRYQSVPAKCRNEILQKLPGDSSVMTYMGHTVRNTLIRCRFSPLETTGQRYIYTGCAMGRVIVYDVLSGKLVTSLKSPSCHLCVRDVSWHPHQVGTLAATAWDGSIQLWTHDRRKDYVEDTRPLPEMDFW